MPLPPSEGREELHLRRIEMRGYRRPDGLFEVDGRVNDCKPYDFNTPSESRSVPAGDFIHDMWVRLVFDENLLVHDVLAVSDSTPYPICREAGATLKKMIGVSIARGWSRAVKERLGGVASCTHLMELLIPLATAAYQSIAPLRWAREKAPEPGVRPGKIDSCFAYSAEREVVKVRWPDHYTGR